MASLTTSGAPVNVNRQRKPLAPVSVEARFLEGADAHALHHGHAILSITDRATGVEALYWAEAVLDAGRIVGVRLAKFITGEEGEQADEHRHQVVFSPDGSAACDCQD